MHAPPEQPRPERVEVAARHLDVNVAGAVMAYDSVGAQLAHRERRPGAVDAHDRRAIDLAELFRIRRKHRPRVEIGRPFELAGFTMLDRSFDPVDTVGAHLIVSDVVT